MVPYSVNSDVLLSVSVKIRINNVILIIFLHPILMTSFIVFTTKQKVGSHDHKYTDNTHIINFGSKAFESGPVIMAICSPNNYKRFYTNDWKNYKLYAATLLEEIILRGICFQFVILPLSLLLFWFPFHIIFNWLAYGFDWKEYLP